MSSPRNQQVALKPQDVVVLLKFTLRKLPSTYARLASELAISASEVHASFRRSQLARLVVPSRGEFEVVRPALREFLIHGVKYAFPPIIGPITRGLPTGYAGPVLRPLLAGTEELPPVWPYPDGEVRGITLYPLYPTVPLASIHDSELYELLTLVDALRIGSARERELATIELTKRLT